MNRTNISLNDLVVDIPDYIKNETDLEFGVSDRLANFMEEKGITKVALAKALGKSPSEVTKWLSGQHNFTLRTIAMLSSYFKKPLIIISTKP